MTVTAVIPTDREVRVDDDTYHVPYGSIWADICWGSPVHGGVPGVVLDVPGVSGGIVPHHEIKYIIYNSVELF